MNIEVPSNNNFETFENISEFKKLKQQKKTISFFRNIVLLSPFAMPSILLVSLRHSSQMVQSSAVTSLNIKHKLSTHEDVDPKEHLQGTNSILAFLQCHSQRLLHPLLHGIANEVEVEIQAEDLHLLSLLLRSPASPLGSGAPSPSDFTMNGLGTELHDLNAASRKMNQSKSEKKSKFDSIEELFKTFILNALCKSIHTSASSPSETFLELLNYSSASRA